LFTLTVEDVESLIKASAHGSARVGICPVFGVALEWRSGARYAGDYSATLDQIIPGAGYHKWNTALISYRANKIKQNYGPDVLRGISEYGRDFRNGMVIKTGALRDDAITRRWRVNCINSRRNRQTKRRFRLGIDDILTPFCCPCCNIALNYEKFDNKDGASATIDRIDPSTSGYPRDRVGVICFDCNTSKGDASPEEVDAVAQWLTLALPDAIAFESEMIIKKPGGAAKPHTTRRRRATGSSRGHFSGDSLKAGRCREPIALQRSLPYGT
jgi:hypothetical protein